MVQQRPHFLLVSLPAQGHINPALRFAKRLSGIGAKVTFITTDRALRRMSKIPCFSGFSISSYSDGLADDDVDGKKVDPVTFMTEIKRHSTEFITNFIVSRERDGQAITCIIYTIFIPWMSDLARELHVPAALLWIQPAAVLNLYYYYFKGFGDQIKNAVTDSSRSLDLPGLPLLKSNDLPSLMIPSSPFAFALETFEQEIEALDKASRSRILVNTFDELETDALRAVYKFDMVAIGPLIPSEFLDGKDPSHQAFGGDLFEGSNDYTDWLDSKPESSVVYVSFGSLAVLGKKQMEELARGLLESGYPFLWVIREKEKRAEEKEEEDDELSCMEELEQQGKIVKWCSQLDVLSHPSLGCFLTHCGWNSTIESLVCGVPMVAFPQLSDQPTNAKLIEDLWKVGFRVKVNGDGLVESEEIKRCLDEIMGNGEKGEEVRRNAMKWKSEAREAGKEGGSADRNLRAFVEEAAQLQAMSM